MNTFYSDVSIDLETLGTAPGSVIMQIGLCAFNADDLDSSVSTTLIGVDPQSALNSGLKIGWDTIAWWMQQSDAARMAMVQCGQQYPLGEALDRVAVWMNGVTEVGRRVWGHGSSFDVTLLECAYVVCERSPPWHYRNVRDLRTLASLYPEIKCPESNVLHKGDDDAYAQAKWIMGLMARHKRAEKAYAGTMAAPST